MAAEQDYHRHSFKPALNGLRYAFAHHSNLKIHTLIGFLALLLGYLVNLNSSDWVFLVITITLVFICELVNTSLEALGDAITLEYREAIKNAKDISAGMVLFSCLAAVIIGLFIFLPYILNLVS